jgi:hypothetical protein
MLGGGREKNMTHKRKRWIASWLTALPLVALGLHVYADVGVGDQAPMFESFNEDMQPVDMSDFIDGRPLVLAVGSAS